MNVSTTRFTILSFTNLGRQRPGIQEFYAVRHSRLPPPLQFSQISDDRSHSCCCSTVTSTFVPFPRPPSLFCFLHLNLPPPLSKAGPQPIPRLSSWTTSPGAKAIVKRRQLLVPTTQNGTSRLQEATRSISEALRNKTAITQQTASAMQTDCHSFHNRVASRTIPSLVFSNPIV